MSDLTDRLEAYGVDLSKTMERFLWDERLYLKCFRMLLEDPNLQKLGAALTAENYKDAFDAAHTLKGVSANMGLTPLYDAVCAIVEPLRANDCGDKDGLMQKYQVIQTEFEKVKQLSAAL